MVNDETTELTLARFRELMGCSRQDAPSIVLIEGGQKTERLEIAELFHSIAKELHPVVDMNLYKDLDHVHIDSSLQSFNLVTATINERLKAYLNQSNKVIVFLYNYEHVYQIDDRLRPFLIEHERVLAWILVSRYFLFKSADARSGGRFRGYHDDERIGLVLVVRPSGVNARHVRRNNGTQKKPVHTINEISNLDTPPTQVQIDIALRAREGQAAFRAMLLQVFNRKCAVTGCSIEQLLEAAHIEPYSKGQNHRLSNGLILRTDIHTLFDKGLLSIEPLKSLTEGRVFIADFLQSDPTYDSLQMKIIDLPDEEAEPRAETLRRSFLKNHPVG